MSEVDFRKVELDECPFCGSLRVRVTDVPSTSIVCLDCGAKGPKGDTYTIAHVKWNQRKQAASAPATGELERALVELCDKWRGDARKTTRQQCAQELLAILDEKKTLWDRMDEGESSLVQP